MAIKKFMVQDTIVSVQQNLKTFTIETEHGASLTVVPSHVRFEQATGYLYFRLGQQQHRCQVVRIIKSDGSVVWRINFAQHGSVTVHEHDLHALTGVTQNNCEPILKSPLAGRVSNVLVQVGDQVKAGQPLLVIESMKMENEIAAPFDAFIKTVFIAQGNVVQTDQSLIEFLRGGKGDGAFEESHGATPIQNR
jgi:biotin carboxyl carrier protein